MQATSLHNEQSVMPTSIASSLLHLEDERLQFVADIFTSEGFSPKDLRKICVMASSMARQIELVESNAHSHSSIPKPTNYSCATVDTTFDAKNDAMESTQLSCELSRVNENKSSKQCMKEFLQGFSGEANKVIEGYKGMSVRCGQKRKAIFLRENNHSKYFSLIWYDKDYLFRDEDIETLVNAHDRFLLRLKDKHPWRDKNYILNGEYRELKTFRELLEFHMEGKTREYQTKIKRFIKRFFSGSWGEKLMANYCRESFKIDFLERPITDRGATDNNELMKIVSAAINSAKNQMNIKIDVQPLFNKGDRSRADKSDKQPPKLSTLALFIEEAYRLGHDRLGLSLIIQLMASTRRKRTNTQLWETVNFNKQFIVIPSLESKGGFVRHPIPLRLVDILTTEKLKQVNNVLLQKDKCAIPVFMFESEFNRGKPLTKFGDYFNYVKQSLLDKEKARGADGIGFKEIKNFQQHRIRDIVEQLLLDVGASEGQKEKCLGRLPSEKAEAYSKLDIDTLSGLKDKMIARIEQEHPELKELFQGLIDNEAE